MLLYKRFIHFEMTKLTNIQAASLGLPEVSSQPAYSTSHRPYRGRGRASRSYYRGAMRGGPPRGSMTLDNRPKKLLVKGAGEDGLQAVHDWYEVNLECVVIRTPRFTVAYSLQGYWIRLKMMVMAVL